MASRRPLPLLWIALLLLGACAAPGRRASRPGATAPLTASAEAASLLDAGRHDDVIRLVELRLPRIRAPEERARLELARARALAGQGKLLSALSAHKRAARDVPQSGPLAVLIHEAWADCELRAGDAGSAAKRYAGLLEDRDLPRADRERLLASLALAADRAGDQAAALDARAALGVRAETLIAASARRLSLAPRAAARPVASRDQRAPTIPADPRLIDADIRTRAAWGARALRSNHDSMHPITAVTVHHSAMPAPGRGSEIDQLRSIQRFHQDDRRWADVGYHFLIDPRGTVWEGRQLAVQGAHAGAAGANVGNIGVCLLGDFDQRTVPPAQQRALEELLDDLVEWFQLDPADVWPHQHFKSSTACPGRHLEPLVAAYRAGRPLS